MIKYINLWLSAQTLRAQQIKRSNNYIPKQLTISVKRNKATEGSCERARPSVKKNTWCLAKTTIIYEKNKLNIIYYNIYIINYIIK